LVLGVSSKAGLAAAAGYGKWHMAGSDGSLDDSRCSRADVGRVGWCRSVAVWEMSVWHIDKTRCMSHTVQLLQAPFGSGVLTQDTGSLQSAGSKLDAPADRVDNSSKSLRSSNSRSDWCYARLCYRGRTTARAPSGCWGWVLVARTGEDLPV
jgi:hypothetical protein